RPSKPPTCGQCLSLNCNNARIDKSGLIWYKIAMMHISEPTSAASTAGDTLAHVTFDPGKRAGTLRQRGLDFLDAPKVWAYGSHSKTSVLRIPSRDKSQSVCSTVEWRSWCGPRMGKSMARNAAGAFL